MALSIADLNTLGIDTSKAPRVEPSPEEVKASRQIPSWQRLVPGSVLSRTLYEAASGRRVTIVDSPPGSGKTTLLVDAALWLSANTDLTLTIAAPTRSAATSVAERLAAVWENASVVLALSGVEKASTSAIHAPGSGSFQGAPGDIVVKTMASLGMSTKTTSDLLIVDEAYQSTFASLAAAAKGCEQVLMVGDPGQIGPVTTADTSVFEDSQYPPHGRAPDVLRRHPSAKILHLPTSYRLGQRTVDAIAPLYDFPFDSGRPDRHVLGHEEIESIQIDRDDPVDLYAEVARLAQTYVGAEVCTDDGTRPLTSSDVCVVAGDNMAVNGIAGFLSTLGLFPGITVGTADRLQGGQWHAVIAVDPLASASTVSDHHLSLGRLCVMASRHMTHMLWVHRGDWRSLIDEQDVEDIDRMVSVRESLVG
ncbi:AAA family ATPase [Brachybacterium kimchii]|uniref:AAA family ATPase n=1 Tax=Brachybacterium kimchii TaxID=2942909 RepID=A0ABY4NB21_9MICO|nr:AAA family ATPase [Brachybacterium kimchii]UQN30490.1 AAA family ATPase [Brachybacterium kimchii]